MKRYLLALVCRLGLIYNNNNNKNNNKEDNGKTIPNLKKKHGHYYWFSYNTHDANYR